MAKPTESVNGAFSEKKLAQFQTSANLVRKRFAQLPVNICSDYLKIVSGYGLKLKQVERMLKDANGNDELSLRESPIEIGW